jgi:hypothetical protein
MALLRWHRSPDTLLRTRSRIWTATAVTASIAALATACGSTLCIRVGGPFANCSTIGQTNETGGPRRTGPQQCCLPARSSAAWKAIAAAWTAALLFRKCVTISCGGLMPLKRRCVRRHRDGGEAE